MKKQYIAAFACILAVACSKAELNEVNPGPSGESMTLTLPHTKVAVSGDSYQFELDDEITAIASNGSRATLKPNAASSGTQTATNYFTGTFDKPVADGSTISFYYNAKSIDDNGTVTFEQNGDPWLVSTGNNFTRTEDRQISVTATLAAPENVRAIAVIFTDSEGIDSFEFHAKDQNIKLETFDGTSFSGNSTVSQNVLNHQSEGIEFMRSNIVYVPKDMDGGFWIKAIKGRQAMYKSYATKNPIENTKVTINSFVPAKVDIDVQISGFATSYSYYVANEGIEGISAKDVNKANSVSNDWMGEGKAVCTITKSGIPSTLLSVKSVSMLVNGEEYSKDYTNDGNNAFTLHKTAHTKWEQKNVSVKVVYSTPDGLEFEGTSNTLTRHITGLPYAINGFSLAGTGTVQKSYTFKTPENTLIKVILSNTTLKTIFRAFDFETYASDTKIGTLSIARKAGGNEANYSSNTFAGTLSAGGSLKFKIDSFDRTSTCKVSKIEVCYNAD